MFLIAPLENNIVPGSSAESTDTIVEEGRSRSLDRKDTKKKKRKRYVYFRLPNKQFEKKKRFTAIFS